MTRWMHGTALMAFLVTGLTAGPQEDPVMRARAQRGTLGNPGDLPPVPQAVLEPPPLPPPEQHVKDTRGYRKGRRGKKGKGGKSVRKGSKGAKAKGAARPHKGKHR